MSYPAYPEYKNFNEGFLGKVPSTWSISPLKHNCTILPSNVDKHTDSGETAVRLCNYTDVYYQDRIVESLDLMKASASRDQIEKFTLQTQDVVITKDSESADDIAIPSFVPRSLPNVVCGYHLAIIRPSQAVDGLFLNYLLMAKPLRAYFEISARGLTRVGLSQFALGGTEVAWPPKEEQTQIARFLDHQTARIDALIAEQQRLIELLKEKRQAVISHAVTKGLDPDVAMKDSGVEWLGEIPAHWQIKRLKHVISAIGGSTPSKDRPEFWGGSIPWVSPKDMKVKVINQTIDQITEEAVLENNLSLAESGMVLIVVRGMILAHSLPLAITGSEVALNQDMKALKAENFINSEYLFDVLSGIRDIAFEFVDSSAHGTRRLEWERFREILLPIPPLSEQRELSHRINAAKGKIDQLSQEAQRAIGLLQERRSTLISAAVTGKIDVRNWEPPVSETFSSSTASEEAPA